MYCTSTKICVLFSVHPVCIVQVPRSVYCFLSTLYVLYKYQDLCTVFCPPCMYCTSTKICVLFSVHPVCIVQVPQSLYCFLSTLYVLYKYQDLCTVCHDMKAGGR